MQAFPNIIAGSLGKGYHSHGASNEKKHYTISLLECFYMLLS